MHLLILANKLMLNCGIDNQLLDTNEKFSCFAALYFFVFTRFPKSYTSNSQNFVKSSSVIFNLGQNI